MKEQKNVGVENIKQIIRMFSVEFESLLWDWNLEGDNIYQRV
jgi:hypothetical protein